MSRANADSNLSPSFGIYFRLSSTKPSSYGRSFATLRSSSTKVCCNFAREISRSPWNSNRLSVSKSVYSMKGAKSKAEPKKADARLSVKRKGSDRAPAKKSKKAAKDPNKPKRPASAFFVFMEEFRKQFKEKNPENKSVAAVGKAGGAKWKSMTEAEKAPYVAKANKRKVDFEKVMADYNKKVAADEENESDKSKSEVHDDDDDDSGEEEDDE